MKPEIVLAHIKKRNISNDFSVSMKGHFYDKVVIELISDACGPQRKILGISNQYRDSA